MDHVTAVYNKEPSFKSRFIHHIQASCHGCMLKSSVLDQGAYTISRDLVMILC